DILLLELTGVADPGDVVAIAKGPAFAERIGDIRVITVLDAEYVLDYNSIFASDRQLVKTLRRQIASAGLVIVNKTDLINPNISGKIEKAVRKLNEKAEILYSVRSHIDTAALLAGMRPNEEPPSAASPFRVLSGHPPADGKP
ncbi:GTP-binding protein, partial [Paenibacillus sepulcri]|nr:GTP-binding protein [Paenibacillus sepulcri]